MSLRPSLASARARVKQSQNPPQNRQFAPQPPEKSRGVGRSINPSTRQNKTRILAIKSSTKKSGGNGGSRKRSSSNGSDAVDLDAILESAKSGSIARAPMPAGKFAWDMSSPVADQRQILRQREIEDSRIEAKTSEAGPLSPPQRIRVASAVAAATMKTQEQQLFNCSPYPSPQNSPRQGTLRASPLHTLSIDLDLTGMLDTKVSSSSPGGNRFGSPARSPVGSPRSPSRTPRSSSTPNAKHGRNPALEPAVMVAYVRDGQKGSPPRRVAVERKRVEYENQNLTDMLYEAGVDVQLMLSDIAKKNEEVRFFLLIFWK